MGLNIKNAEVERLAAEVARLAGETKTEAIRKALEERRDRLQVVDREERKRRVMAWLKKEVWPDIGGGGMPSQEEQDEWLGYNDYDASAILAVLLEEPEAQSLVDRTSVFA
ncbi:MAG: type II toxin-antitoxin system VapB family antitoxin [Candidatus Xenobia bacterium]